MKNNRTINFVFLAIFMGISVLFVHGVENWNLIEWKLWNLFKYAWYVFGAILFYLLLTEKHIH